MSSIVNFDNFDRGTVLKVKCRDGKTRTVTAKVWAMDGPDYPHQITGEDSHLRRSVTNEGRIFRSSSSSDSWDVFEIIREVAVDQEPNPSRPKPVARGYNRRDQEPKAVHGSKRWGQILWRDSSDNELRLFSVDDEVPGVFDQWFPLSEIDFQVEEVTESLIRHREAVAKWSELDRPGFSRSFIRGFLAGKGVPFVEDDYARAAREAAATV